MESLSSSNHRLLHWSSSLPSNFSCWIKIVVEPLMSPNRRIGIVVVVVFVVVIIDHFHSRSKTIVDIKLSSSNCCHRRCPCQCCCHRRCRCRCRGISRAGLASSLVISTLSAYPCRTVAVIVETSTFVVLLASSSWSHLRLVGIFVVVSSPLPLWSKSQPLSLRWYRRRVGILVVFVLVIVVVVVLLSLLLKHWPSSMYWYCPPVGILVVVVIFVKIVVELLRRNLDLCRRVGIFVVESMPLSSKPQPLSLCWYRGCVGILVVVIVVVVVVVVVSLPSSNKPRPDGSVSDRDFLVLD